MATAVDTLRRSTINLGAISESLESSRRSVSSARNSIDNISNVINSNNQIRRDFYSRSRLLEYRRLESDRRKISEDNLEINKISQSKASPLSVIAVSNDGPLSRLLRALGYITAGWIMNNLPTWIFMGEQFIKRIKKLKESLDKFVTNTKTVIDNFTNAMGAFYSSLINLDFEAFSDGEVSKSFDELNESISILGDDIVESFKIFTTPLNEDIDTGEKAPVLGEVRSNAPDDVSRVGSVDQQALLKTIRYAEGTSGPTGYSMFFGDNYGEAKYGDLTKLSVAEVEQLVDKFLKDPQSQFRDKTGKLDRSAAVGAYQFINITGLAKSVGMDTNRKFDKEFQDELALKLAARAGVTPEVLRKEGLSDAVIKKLSPTWASFPGNTYNQPTKQKSQLKQVYQQSLDKEKNAVIQGQPKATLNGYRVTSGGKTINSISQLGAHAGKTRTSYAGSRLITDFTLYKGNEFLNIPVPSPVDGTVNWAGYAGNGGKWVEIESPQGLVELGHFNSLNVQTGDKVTVGSILGLQGHSGRTVPPGPEGTHVHIQAPDSVIQNYISTLVSGSNVSGGSVERKEKDVGISPKPPNPQRISTPERKGSEIIMIDDTKPSAPSSGGSSGGGAGYRPVVSEFNMLNNFIKKKLLTDLSFL